MTLSWAVVLFVESLPWPSPTRVSPRPVLGQPGAGELPTTCCAAHRIFPGCPRARLGPALSQTGKQTGRPSGA